MTAHAAPTPARTETQRPGERRAAPRYRCLSECLVRLEGAPEPLDWPGMLYNISATGVGLALPFPAPVGAVLTVEPRRRRPAGMRLRARIVRGGLEKFVWFHGCAFVAPLSEGELRRWLTHLCPGPFSGGFDESPALYGASSQAI
jgi:hypothetical protein